MSADVLIHGNRLRLLCRVFLAIVPLDSFKVQEKGKYNCIVESFGNVGVVECISSKVVHFGAVNDEVNYLSDSIWDYKEWYRRAGYFNTSKVQLVYCRFIRRKDEVFAKMIDKGTVDIGLNLRPQTALF